jgi:hypothetical protein
MVEWMAFNPLSFRYFRLSPLVLQIDHAFALAREEGWERIYLVKIISVLEQSFESVLTYASQPRMTRTFFSLGGSQLIPTGSESKPRVLPTRNGYSQLPWLGSNPGADFKPSWTRPGRF